MIYEPVIGLEVHVELATRSKMFCRDSADYFGKEPNTHVCPVCLGLPGALPVPNKQAIVWCLMIGLVLNCQIPNFSKFDRKNYFYPDLPKGYQISQWDKPFCVNGAITIKSGKKIRIRRVHMEEDTAKLTHAVIGGKKVSLIDFNRSGVPLVEIVTEPDFSGAEEVIEYLKHLQQIIRFLGVSSADMEKGDMRLEPNLSLREVSKALPNYKVEIKNINSFRFVEKAISFEIKRQTAIHDRGEVPVQETRGWNETKSQTVSQRSKEEAYDYRYFPEPDLPPFVFEKAQVETLKEKLPELPGRKFARFKKDYKLSDYDVEILTREKHFADYFEEAVRVGQKHKVSAKQIANYIINKKPNMVNILPAALVKTIAGLATPIPTDEAKLEAAVTEIVNENAKAVKDYKDGKASALMFLIGQVMRKLAGKADPNLVKLKLKEKLNSKH